MKTDEKAKKVISALEKRYPDGECGLEWTGDPYRLLMMAILSAQCTDVRVNAVSAELFAEFPTVYDLAQAETCRIAEIIKPVGLYKSKALALKESAVRIATVYGGEVPSAMEDLLPLRGVGRKVANLIRGDVFGLGGIVADTHCIRVCGRLGLSDGSDAFKTEKALDPLIPREKQSDFCHRLVLFGREICTARSPKCAECELVGLCGCARG